MLNLISRSFGEADVDRKLKALDMELLKGGVCSQMCVLTRKRVAVPTPIRGKEKDKRLLQGNKIKSLRCISVLHRVLYTQSCSMCQEGCV